MDLVLEGGDWAAWPEMAALPHPDTRIVHSFHYYDPFEMTHQLAPWTWQGPYPAREWTPEKGADEVTRDLEAAARTTAAPILLGEFGVYRQAETATRAAWTRPMCGARQSDWAWAGVSGASPRISASSMPPRTSSCPKCAMR
jgi:endoglucanase